MKASAVLFVGGPLDGKRKMLPSDRLEYRTILAEPLAVNRTEVSVEDHPVGEEVCYRFVWSQKGAGMVFGFEPMSFEDVLYYLISSYGVGVYES